MTNDEREAVAGCEGGGVCELCGDEFEAFPGFDIEVHMGWHREMFEADRD